MPPFLNRRSALFTSVYDYMIQRPQHLETFQVVIEPCEPSEPFPLQVPSTQSSFFLLLGSNVGNGIFKLKPAHHQVIQRKSASLSVLHVRMAARTAFVSDKNDHPSAGFPARLLYARIAIICQFYLVLFLLLPSVLFLLLLFPLSFLLLP